MTKGIQYAIAAVQDVLLAQTGVRGGPDNPPDKISAAEPFAVCMAGPGVIDYFDGCTYFNPVTLRLWLTVAHKNTPNDDKIIVPYGDSVPKALWATIDLSSTVDSIEQIRIGGYGPWTINGMARYGWYWEIDVRITSC